MNRCFNVSLLAATVGVASLLVSGVAHASTITTTSSLYTGSAINLSTDVGPGMNSNVDWVHFFGNSLILKDGVPASGNSITDLAKNVTPLINRTMTFTARAGQAWPVAEPWVSGYGPTCSYSDAASTPASGSTTSAGMVQQGDVTMTVAVPDTKQYVLSIYGNERWEGIAIKSASLSDGTLGGSKSAGSGSTSLYRFDIAFQASLPNETLTVTFGPGANGQPVSFSGAILSTVVPEPAGLSLLALGGFAAMRRRRV